MRDEIPVVMSIVSGAVAFDTHMEPTDGALSPTTMLYVDAADGYRRQNPRTLDALDLEFKRCASDEKAAPALGRMADALRMIADRIDATLERKHDK